MTYQPTTWPELVAIMDDPDIQPDDDRYNPEPTRCHRCGYRLDDYAPDENECGACVDNPDIQPPNYDALALAVTNYLTNLWHAQQTGDPENIEACYRWETRMTELVELDPPTNN